MPGEEKTDNNKASFTAIFTQLASLAAAVDELTSTRASSRWRPRAWRCVALLLAIVLAVQAAPPARRPARRARATATQRDLVAHAARLETGFIELREWVEERARRARRAAWRRAERGSTAASPTASLVRYDAYGEMSGHQSSSRRAARRAPLRRRDLVDPAPRPGAGLREADARGRARARALARGAAGGRHRGAPARRTPRPPDVRVALPRARGHLHRGGPARVRARRAWSEIPYPTVYETVMAVQRRRRRARGRADRELARGRRWPPRSTRSRARPTDVRIAAEVIHPIHHCLIAPDGARARATSTRVISHPQAIAQCAALPARARCRAPSGVSTASTAEAVRIGRRARRALGRDRRRAWPPSSTAATVLAEGVEDHARQPDALRLAGARRRRAARPRRDQDLDRVLGLQRRVAGRARATCCASSRTASINLTKIESRPRRVRLGHYMFFADLEGPRTTPGCRRRSRRCAAGRGAARARLLRRRPRSEAA